MIKAVIFDMDGLMFNTEVMFKKQFRDALDVAHIQCPDSVIESMIGCSSRTIKRYENQYPGITEVMEDCQQNRVDYFFDYFKKAGDANMPGLENLVHYLEDIHMPFAIASSSYIEDILRFIDYAGFPIEPKAIVSGRDGFPSKPAPDIFLEAAKRLGMRPEDCLVLEDSKHGITAAYRAGMDSIFVPDQVKPDDEMKQYIKHTCKDLNEVIEFLKK